jgi:hypothetical protein
MDIYENPSESALSLMIVPLLMEIGKRVNKRLFLYSIYL